MTSPILENADIKNFLLKKIVDKNVVNIIVDMTMNYNELIVGGEYPITTCRGREKTNHNNIIITKKTKKMISFKSIVNKCAMKQCGGWDVTCYEKRGLSAGDTIPEHCVLCGHCKEYIEDKTYRKKIYIENDIEYIQPDIWGLKKHFDVYANKIVKRH